MVAHHLRGTELVHRVYHRCQSFLVVVWNSNPLAMPTISYLGRVCLAPARYPGNGNGGGMPIAKKIVQVFPREVTTCVGLKQSQSGPTGCPAAVDQIGRL